MSKKTADLKQELQDIWTIVFGEPPIIEAEPALMASILKGHLSLDPAIVCPALPVIPEVGAAAD